MSDDGAEVSGEAVSLASGSGQTTSAPGVGVRIRGIHAKLSESGLVSFRAIPPSPNDEERIVPDADRLTLAQIAAMAGVSLSTASKVLNGRPGVGLAKRDEILGLLDQNGYQRRGTKIRKPVGLIDLAIPGLDTLWALEILLAAEEEAARARVGLVVTSTHGRTLGSRHWIKSLARRRSDGLVLVVSRLQEGTDAELERLHIPYVMIDPIGTAATTAPVIGATNLAGGIMATQHLLDLGHRDIGIIAGVRELLCSQERLDGYRAALVRAGIQPRSELVRFGDFLATGGYRGAEALLDLPNPPTAIFAGSDHQAFGVYEVAKKRGLSIPGDLSVVGFDDLPMCEWLSPPLTTVRQPLEDMAREATRMVLTMAYQGMSPLSPKRELATNLVIRESTAPPRR